MKPWKIFVRVTIDSTGRKEWRAVRPTGGQPYEYATREEAEKMAALCYGDPRTPADDVAIGQETP